MRYKYIILTYICKVLELLCTFTHPFVELEIHLTGRHCNLATLSYYINEKYNLGAWRKPE